MESNSKKEANEISVVSTEVNGMRTDILPAPGGVLMRTCIIDTNGVSVHTVYVPEQNKEK